MTIWFVNKNYFYLFKIHKERLTFVYLTVFRLDKQNKKKQFETKNKNNLFSIV